MENICEWSQTVKKLENLKLLSERDNSKKIINGYAKNILNLFNKSWNYFDGMSQNEIEIFLKSDSHVAPTHTKFGLF